MITKSRLKKILIVSLTVLILYMQTIILPGERQKAEAWAIALPAGITAGAGVYVLGALAIGAVAMTINEAYGEEIQAHAKKVWNSSTQLAKDSLYYSYQAAYTAGETMVNLGSDFVAWATSKTTALISGSLGLSHSLQQINNRDKITATYSSDTEYFTYTTAYPNVTISRNMGTTITSQKLVKFTFQNTDIDAFLVESYGYSNNANRQAYSSVEIFQTPALSPYETNNGSIYFRFSNPVVIEGYTTHVFNTSTQLIKIANSMPAVQLAALINSIRTVEDVMSLIIGAQSLGSSDSIYVANIPTIAQDYITAKNYLDNSMQRIITNPLPIPVPDVYPVNPANSEPLIWDDVATTYKDIAGNPYVGDVTWNIPIPQVKEIDGTTTVVIPIENDFVDVITGDVVAVPTSPVPNPPLTPPKTDWLNRMRAVVTTKFPFSLPWDFYSMLALLSAEPLKPHIQFSQDYMGMPVEFEIKFDFLDPYIVFFRTFIIIGFCISLIMGTRKLLGGAT